MSKTRPLATQLWEKVEVRGGDACWEWRGARQPDGYGHLSHAGRFIGSHRAAWLVTRGPIPDGLCVLHECDNPPCCRPDHLFLGTQTDNALDRERKGRGRRYPLSEIALVAVADYHAGEDSMRAISARYEVSSTTICRWVHR